MTHTYVVLLPIFMLFAKFNVYVPLITVDNHLFVELEALDVH